MPFFRLSLLAFLLGFTFSSFAQWLPVGGGANSRIQALSVYQNQLVAGGRFTSIDSVAAAKIAAWNGTTWQALGAGMNSNVEALTMYNNELVAGGDFTLADSLPANRIARWNGTDWDSLGVGFNQSVNSLQVYNGNLVAGGKFTQAGGSTARHIAQWNGTAWSPLVGGTDSAVKALTVYNNQLIAAGHFTTAGGTPASRIAAWNGTGWQALGDGLNGPVYAMQVYQNELYATGDFTYSGSVPVSHLARWNGSSWSNVQDGLNQAGRAFAVFNNTLIIGGDFTLADTTQVNHLARWDGRHWFPFGRGVNGQVNALAKWNDQLFTGGSFTGPTGDYISSWQPAHSGPVRPIGEGYGANGNYTVQLDSFPNPLIPTQPVYVFRPLEATGKVPVLFFSTAQASSRYKRYDALIEHIVSTGHVLVFPTRKDSLTDIYFDTAFRYETMWNGFTEAVKLYPNLMDTTRVGFMGHSFGGGAVPAMAKRGLQDRGWGANGNFLFQMAPWYTLGISQAELQSFPANTKLLTQVYDIDKVVSERLGIDVFENINIPDSEKDFITVRSDTIAGYWLAADHKVPYTSGPTTENDGLDFYAVYRKYDALSHYAFTGDSIAKLIALGNGSPLQTYMGKAPDSTDINRLTVSDNPTDLRADSLYTYRCNVPFNPRQQYCTQPLSVAPEVAAPSSDFNLFPNPAEGLVQIELKNPAERVTVRVVNGLGQVIVEQLFSAGEGAITLDLSGISRGIYLVEISDRHLRMREKLLVN